MKLKRRHFRTAALALLCMATAMPAWAQASNDWRKKLGVFRIGILGGNRPLLETRQFQPFRKTLQKALGVPVEVFPAKDHKALVEALVGGRIEYAPLSITAFAAAWNSCKCVEPIALPRATDGSTAFRSVLITKRGGPRSLRSLKGKTTIVPGKHSFAGFLYPREILAEEQVKLGSVNWPINDQLNMDNAIDALVDDKGDALLGWIPDLKEVDSRPKRGTLHALADKLQLRPNEFPVIWKSAPIPYGPHVVRKDLGSEAKKLVWKTLRDLKSSEPEAYDAIEPTFGGGFVAAGVETYLPLVKTLSSGGSKSADPEKKSP